MKSVVKYQNQRPNLFSLFDDMFFGNNDWSGLQAVSQPSVNVKENETSFVIELAAPGLQREDFNIEIEHDQLVLSARKEETKAEGDDSYKRREFNYSSFTRSFHLDGTIDIDNISAQYNEGILAVNLPKKEEAQKKVKKIEIG